MRAFVITLAGAVGGAALAVTVILVMAQNGMMPINDIGRPQLNDPLGQLFCDGAISATG
jgi:hypothetical protein